MPAEICKFKLKMMDTVFTISFILPPKKYTQNRFGVFNCYRKN